MTLITWIGIIVCISQSAMLSGMNLAFFTVSKLALRIEVARNNKHPARALSLREDANFLLVLGVAPALVVLQDTAPIQIRFLWLTGQVPAILLLFLTAAGGFVMGQIIALLVKGSAKLKRINL